MTDAVAAAAAGLPRGSEGKWEGVCVRACEDAWVGGRVAVVRVAEVGVLM